MNIITKVEGVPALIHQTEVSWDATLDPASFFKVGQVKSIYQFFKCILLEIEIFILILLLEAEEGSFKMQIVDAKVHQLDFSLERIFLSLKEITVIIIILGECHYGVKSKFPTKGNVLFFIVAAGSFDGGSGSCGW